MADADRPYEEAGKLIEARRKELGLAQKEFAAKVGTTQHSISNWERGESWPRKPEDRRKLGELGVDVQQINAIISRIKGLHARASEEPANYGVARPVIGAASCGPFLAAAPDEFDAAGVLRTRPVLPEMTKDPQAFWVVASGESMIDVGIQDGDEVLVEKSVKPKSGDIALVCVDDEATIKRWIDRGKTVVLQSENKDVPDREMTKADFTRRHGRAARVAGWDPPFRRR